MNKKIKGLILLFSLISLINSSMLMAQNTEVENG
jgi:hypothetical protein